MPLASVQVETTLIVLKFAFLVILYLFIWRIVRSAARDLRLPQESMILSPQQASMLLAQPQGRELGRIVVTESKVVEPGAIFPLGRQAFRIGRGNDNELTLAADEYVSTSHARLDPRRDGIYVEDTGSTNGTFVNAVRISSARRLAPGDILRIGETELRFEL